ncbi:hypothetical protein AB833_06820 [Chromatiales bacterium (ex Bugula neritina AB1)]|nr:hypothetical protein AB833_06820 [Chromatiales bacterium (ex Bugula neritina AB1)]
MTFNNTDASGARAGRRTSKLLQQPWLPGVLSLIVFVAALVVVYRSLHGVRLDEVKLQLSQIGGLSVAAAIVLTLCSYFLITLYDYLALKHVGFPMTWARMMPTAFSASAIGHNVGFAALSGGAIRYRGYSMAGLDPARITGVVVFCVITYFVGGSLLLGVVLLTEPASVLQNIVVPGLSIGLSIQVLGVVCIVGSLTYVLWSLVPGSAIKVGALQIKLPRVVIVLWQIALGATDVFLAAFIMYLLLPSGFDMPYMAFLGIYLISMAIAAVSNVPGGIGVFEGGILMLVNEIPKPELVASLVAFRLVYYLLPLIFGLIVFVGQLFHERRTRPAGAPTEDA